MDLLTVAKIAFALLMGVTVCAYLALVFVPQTRYIKGSRQIKGTPLNVGIKNGQSNR